MAYNETPTKGIIMKPFKNTAHTGVKNVIARIKPQSRKKRYEAYLEDYKKQNPDWYPFKAVQDNMARYKASTPTRTYVMSEQVRPMINQK